MKVSYGLNYKTVSVFSAHQDSSRFGCLYMVSIGSPPIQVPSTGCSRLCNETVTVQKHMTRDPSSFSLQPRLFWWKCVFLCVFRRQRVVKVSMVLTVLRVQVDTRRRAQDTVRSDSLCANKSLYWPKGLNGFLPTEVCFTVYGGHHRKRFLCLWSKLPRLSLSLLLQNQ